MLTVDVIFFCVTVIKFMSSCTCEPYSFETIFIDYVFPDYEKAVTNESVTYVPPLIEQRLVCDLAKEHESADSADLTRVDVQAGAVKVRYLNGPVKDQIILRCPTIPRLYIQLPQNTTQLISITILKRTNEFLNPGLYKFTLETTQFIWRISPLEKEILNPLLRDMLSSKSKMDDRLKSHYLSKTTNYQRQMMCVAAKKRVSNSHSPVHLLPDEWIERAAIYETVLPNGTRDPSVVAFACNSTPKIYLRVIEEYSKKEFVVMTATVSSS